LKKFVSLLLALAMTLSIASTVMANQAPEPWGSITWLTTTQFNADMMGGWSSLASNNAVMDLIHGGAGTLYMNPGGNWEVNPKVVKNMETVDNADGSKTYTMEIFDDWVFNNGTPVTAKHYVFSILYSGSKEFGELDANNTGGFRFVGYDEWSKGEAAYFSGVRLLGDYTFSVTIDAKHLPYYWEFTYASVGPAAIEVMAPGCDIADDGNGAYITGPWSTELIRESLMNPETGYRFAPKVTVGPYNLVHFTRDDNYAVVERNMLFKGHWDDTFPLINQIILRYVNQPLFLTAMEAGEGDIVTGTSGYNDILGLLDMVDAGILWEAQYDRPGFGYLGFQCDQGPTSFPAVRQAVAWSLDRDEFNRIFLGGLAVVVNSEYATAQYIYTENQDWLEDNLTHYTYNPEKAIEVLEEDGWIYNADGSLFGLGFDPVRHKKIIEADGREWYMPLVIEWLSSQGDFSDVLRAVWIPAAHGVGIQVNETNVEFGFLSDNWARVGMNDEDAQFFAYNLAVNYTSVITGFWNTFSDEPQFWGGGYNNMFLKDDEVIRLSQIMYNATSKEEYDEAWLDVLVRLNYLLPRIPIYSNIWFDFVRNDIGLENYTGSSYWGFQHAIQRAWLAK